MLWNTAHPDQLYPDYSRAFRSVLRQLKYEVIIELEIRSWTEKHRNLVRNSESFIIGTAVLLSTGDSSPVSDTTTVLPSTE